MLMRRLVGCLLCTDTVCMPDTCGVLLYVCRYGTPYTKGDGIMTIHIPQRHLKTLLALAETGEQLSPAIVNTRSGITFQDPSECSLIVFRDHAVAPRIWMPPYNHQDQLAMLRPQTRSIEKDVWIEDPRHSQEFISSARFQNRAKSLVPPGCKRNGWMQNSGAPRGHKRPIPI